MSEQTITLTLKRPLPTYRMTERAGWIPGKPIPAGTTLTLAFDDHGIFYDGDCRVSARSYGEWDILPALLAAAEEPCESVVVEIADDSTPTPKFLDCPLNTAETPLLCMGDKKKCPFSEVRAETKEGDTNG